MQYQLFYMYPRWLSHSLLFAILGLSLDASLFDGNLSIRKQGEITDSFGSYNMENYPWIYHREHGWIYGSKQDDGSAWIWSTETGWQWVSEKGIPNLYDGFRGWVFSGNASRDFGYFDLTSQEWVNSLNQGGWNSYFPVPQPGEHFSWGYLINSGEAVPLTIDGLPLKLQNWTCSIDFLGNSLEWIVNMNSVVHGSFSYNGSLYQITGDMEVDMVNSYAKSPLGLFFLQGEGTVNMLVEIAGSSARSASTIQSNLLSGAAPRFLYRNDLYEHPVGHVFTQIIGDWELEMDTKAYQNGILQKDASFTSHSVTDAILTAHIVEKYDTYYAAGRRYTKVVKIRMSEHFGNTAGNLDLFTTMDLWLAPGIGVIEAYEEDSDYDTAIHMVLNSCSLW